MVNLLSKNLNKCWCEFCGRAVEKEEKCLTIFKNVWKGTTRINVCKDCLIRMFVELNVKNKEVSNIRKEVILENLK